MYEEALSDFLARENQWTGEMETHRLLPARRNGCFTVPSIGPFRRVLGPDKQRDWR